MNTLGIFSGIVLACCCLATSATQAHAESKIFYAVVPMSAKEADFLVRRLVAQGMPKDWARDFRNHFRTTEFDNSRPFLIPTQTGHVCVATAMRYDIDKVMKFAPCQDEDTRQAIQDFLLAHEASHCSEVQTTLKYLLSDESAEELESFRLWLEESLADHRARLAAHQWGRAGYNAVMAWERRRFFDMLSGDLEHWSTPLINVMVADATTEHADLTQVAAALGGEAAYQSIERGWLKLRRALFAGEDGSAEQMVAWDDAVNTFSEGIRPAIPSLSELRDSARAIWPDAVDWRLKVIGRSKPPS